MLVGYLSEAGYDAVAIDCYGDSDTREMALDYCFVPGLALADIQEPVLAMKNRHGLNHAIYGSGFESNLPSLNFLQGQFTLLGNAANRFARVQDKKCFFQRLDDLGIAHPAVSFSPPVSEGHWLVKPPAGEGGLGIHRYRPDSLVGVESSYWQHYIDGMAMSVLFVATQGGVAIVGYQRQLLCTNNSSQPFLFAGALSWPELPGPVRSIVAGWALKLAQCYRLRGLNSLDFILLDGRCYALEVNARPPASLQLYGADIIEAHIKAVLRGTVVETVRPEHLSAYKILYAEREILIDEKITWPRWTADRPGPGSRIGQGEPICSIIARAKNRQQLMDRLRNKQQVVEKLLNTGS